MERSITEMIREKKGYFFYKKYVFSSIDINMVQTVQKLYDLFLQRYCVMVTLQFMVYSK